MAKKGPCPRGGTQRCSLTPRESIYQHLSQTSPDNTNKNVSQYSIDPATRYPNINLHAIKANQVPGPELFFGVQNPGSLLPSPTRAWRRVAILLSPHRGLGDTGWHGFMRSPVPQGCQAEAAGPQGA